MEQLSEDIASMQNTVKTYFQTKTQITNPESGYNLLRIQDQIYSTKDMREAYVQIMVGAKDQLQSKWDKIFGLDNPMRFRDILKELYQQGLGLVTGHLKISELKTEKQRYELAMIFAIDLMNHPVSEAGLRKSRAEVHTETVAAIDEMIAKLEALEKRTVERDWRLAMLKQYKSVQQLALEIATGQGSRQLQAKGFIEQEYKKVTDDFWNRFEMKDFERAAYVNFYTPRIYNERIIDLGEGDFSFATTTGRLIQRQSESLASAMKRGNILAFKSFLPAVVAGANQAINVAANRELIASGLNEGFFKTTQDKGYGLLKARGAKLRKYLVTVIEKEATIGLEQRHEEEFDDYERARAVALENQTSVRHEDMDLFAPREVADYINKITEKSRMRDNPFILGMLATNAKLKGLKIVWGMFHRRSFIWSAMMAGITTPGMEIYRSDFKKGKEKDLWEKVKDRFNYSAKRDLGHRIMNQGFKEFYTLSYYGMTLFRIQDLGRATQQYLTRGEKWLGGDSRGVSAKLINKYIGKFATLTNRMQNELFGIFGSTLKTATAYNEILHHIQKHSEKIAKEKEASQKKGVKGLSPAALAYYRLFPERLKAKNGEFGFEDYYSETEDTIYRGVAGFANADFGGLHVGRLGVTKDFQDKMRLLFLGPDWTASNIISATKLFQRKKTNTSGGGTIFSGSAIEQEIYKMFWLRIMARSAILMVAINLLMAGIDDETVWQRLRKAKRRKGFKMFMTDISPMIHMLGGDKGTDHYLNQTGHFLDIPKIATNPAGMLYNKSGSLLKPTLDIMSGTRYDKKRPTSIGDIGKKGLYTWDTNRRGPLGLDELPAYMIYQTSQVLPIQLRNQWEVFNGERNLITGAGASFLGLDIKQTYDNVSR
jgi:hypothetical protein